MCRWHCPFGRELKSLWMKMEEESKKAGLKLNIQNTKIMAFGPITSWLIDRENMETVTDFIFLGSKSHCRWWLQPWNWKALVLWKKIYDKLNVLKSRDTTSPTMVCLVKAMVFPVVMYGCESWTVKKAERPRIDAFESWCWRSICLFSTSVTLFLLCK